MTPERNPWKDHDDREPPRHGGPWLWLIVAAGVAGLVWLLVSAFPQRGLDQGDWAQLVKLGAILVLLSSGVVYLRRARVSETLRNLAIWAAIGGVLLLGYSFRHDLAFLTRPPSTLDLPLHADLVLVAQLEATLLSALCR